MPRLLRDENAQTTIEYVLLLGTIIVPMAAFILAVMDAVGRFYSVTSWVVYIPFP